MSLNSTIIGRSNIGVLVVPVSTMILIIAPCSLQCCSLNGQNSERSCHTCMSRKRRRHLRISSTNDTTFIVYIKTLHSTEYTLLCQQQQVSPCITEVLKLLVCKLALRVSFAVHIYRLKTFTLQQAMKGQRGNRRIPLLFL